MKENEFYDEEIDEAFEDEEKPHNEKDKKQKVKTKKSKKSSTKIKKSKPKTKVEKQIIYRDGKKRGHPIIIFLLILIIILLVGVIGYLVYENYYKGKDETKVPNNTNEVKENVNILSESKALKLGNNLYEKAYKNGLALNGYNIDGGLLKYVEVKITDEEFIEEVKDKGVLNGEDNIVYKVTNFDKAIKDIYTENYISSVIDNSPALYKYNDEYYLINVGKVSDDVYKDTSLTIKINKENEITFETVSSFESGKTIIKTFKIAKEDSGWKVAEFSYPE